MSLHGLENVFANSLVQEYCCLVEAVLATSKPVIIPPVERWKVFSCKAVSAMFLYH